MNLKELLQLSGILAMTTFAIIGMTTIINGDLPVEYSVGKDQGEIPHYKIEIVSWDYIGELKPNQIRGNR